MQDSCNNGCRISSKLLTEERLCNWEKKHVDKLEISLIETQMRKSQNSQKLEIINEVTGHQIEDVVNEMESQKFKEESRMNRVSKESFIWR